MTKIMLVEDDNNLREIYEARLLAEGYEIVSAKDGEEALAMAVKEKPDLIISDVMMPKISGFDMLDILRSTPETKNTKVIMMTALSQSEDKARADKLGADRYLVKSQVTLEDVAKVAREVLSGEEGTPTPGSDTPPAPSAPTTPAATSDTAATDAKASTTSDDSSASAADPKSSATDAAASSTQVDPVLAATLADEEASVDAQIGQFVAKPTPSGAEPPAAPPTEAKKDEADALNEPSETITSPPPTEAASSKISVKDAPEDAGGTKGKESESGSAKEDEVANAVNKIVKDTESPGESKEDEPSNGDNVPIAHKKVIEPINDMTQKGPNLEELAAKEEQKESSAAAAVVTSPPAESVEKSASPPDAKSEEAVATHAPGNVITPAGSKGTEQPSDVAL